MSYPIGSAVSVASSFALKATQQNSFLISSISKIAFLSLSCLAASIQVIPTILPITLCLLVGLIISSSLIQSLPSSCCAGVHYIPLSPRRVIPWRHCSFPVQEIKPRIFSSHPYPRTDFVGERGEMLRPSFMPSRPSFVAPSIIRRDRVGERPSF